MRPPSPARLATLVVLACPAAWLVAALLGDRLYFANGLDAHFYAVHEGRRESVCEVVEHRIDFENRYRALSRIVQGWPFGRLPIPTGTPVLDATIRARLEVPEGAPTYLVIDAHPPATVLLDGEPLGASAVSPGDHLLDIDWGGGRSTTRRTFGCAGDLSPI